MDISNIIFKKISGEISLEEQRSLDAWLGESDSHKKMYQDILNSGDIPNDYRIYKDIDVNQRWHQFRKTYVNSSHTARIIKLRPWLVSAIGIAAMVAIVIGISFLHHTPTLKTSQPVAVSHAVKEAIAKSEHNGRCEAQVIIDGNAVKVSSRLSDSILAAVMQGKSIDCEVKTEDTKEFWMTLPDGTRVHLDGGTRIAYTSDFGVSSRTVYLHGTAFFYVAKNKDLAFIVKTDNGDVKEYGTEFNVEASSRRTSVVLVSGSVSLQSGNESEKMLKPSHRGDMEKGKTVSIEPCDVRPYVAWNEGRFVFDDCSLDILFRLLDKWYGTTTSFAIPSLKNIKVTGTFDKYQQPSDIWQAVEVAGNVKITGDGKNMMIDEK